MNTWPEQLARILHNYENDVKYATDDDWKAAHNEYDRKYEN